MKVYFVMPAPIGDEDLNMLAYGASLPIEAFHDFDDALRFAKRMAAKNQGEQFWVFDASPTTAFSAEPVPVFERVPEIGAF